MPILELIIQDSQGSLIAVYIKHTRDVLPPKEVKALIDTGAQTSSLDPSIVTELGLLDIEGSEVQSFTNEEPVPVPRTVCNLVIPGPGIEMEIFDLPVLVTPLKAQGFDAILGRDILSKCLVVWDGRAKRCTISY